MNPSTNPQARDLADIDPRLLDMSEEELIELLEKDTQELNKDRWFNDPVAWAEEKIGVQLWSIQKQILEALVTHRKVAVASCHEIGKSFISGIAVGWWIDRAPAGEAFVVTSAPSTPQVKTILWREIGRVHMNGGLDGRLNQAEWFREIKGKDGQTREEIVAMGRKPNDYDHTSFQGIHARRVLYVFDEACGMPAPLWEAADSLIANDNSRGLAIGNPDDPTAEFAQICKPGSGWHVIWVSAFDTPNFTGEDVPDKLKEVLVGRLYVEEKRRKWARNWIWVDAAGHQTSWQDGVRVVAPPGVNPDQAGSFWHSKVLGRFPPVGSEGGLIPMSWITAAQERSLPPGYPIELGVDVGGGGDSSCGCERRGSVYRIRWEDRNPDTMQTCGNAAHALETTGATVVKVDVIGIGRGVVDRGKELNLPFEGINVGEAADDPKAYLNKRAENWWHVRELFELGQIDIDPLDEDLASELVEIRYKRTSAGKIQIESKDDAKRRGVPSPNRAEALMLAACKQKKKLRKATWGTRH